MSEGHSGYLPRHREIDPETWRNWPADRTDELVDVLYERDEYRRALEVIASVRESPSSAEGCRWIARQAIDAGRKTG
jgi:hypothetical protein